MTTRAPLRRPSIRLSFSKALPARLRWPAQLMLLALGAGLPMLALAQDNWAEYAEKVANGEVVDCGATDGAVIESTNMRPVVSAPAKGQCASGKALTGRLPSADFDLPAMKATDAYVAVAPDLSKFIAEDAKAIGVPLRYGVEVATPRLGLRDGKPSSGSLQQLPDGRQVWRALIISPGAKSIDFEFAKLQLPAGAELFISDVARTVIRGPIRAADVQASGRYFSPYVPGDSAVLELAMSADSVAETQVELANLAHAYRDLGNMASLRKSGSCNVDTICPLGDSWRDQIDSVGHYTARAGGSSFVCTGSLIANTRRDSTPNFLTANHCISSEATADSVVVFWNFQSSVCRTPGSTASGTPISSSTATHTQSGSMMLATSSASDFTLLRLDSAVPTASGPFWSGWDNRDASPTYVVSIHHPSGDEKRISDSTEQVTPSAYLGAANSGSSNWRIPRWSNGTTEGGSSGSGLWNQNRRLIGQLQGGFASCTSPTADYYGRLSQSWNGGGTPTSRLRDWLDPTNSNASAIDGNRASTGGGGADPQDEPFANGVALPPPNPTIAGCPGGFFIATVTDGPGAGLSSGAFGLELLLDSPGTRVLSGGLNFGGLVDSGQVGFAGFNFTNAANENQRLNVSLRGSPSNNANGLFPVRVKIVRQTSATNSTTVFEATANISLAQTSTASISVPPGFYVATVAVEGAGVVGGSPEGQFFFELTTSFVDRPGGGFQGGAVVGGYHAIHPFQGVSGFAGFCLATPHSASAKVLSQPSYGPSGARDLRLGIQDPQGGVIISVPGG